MDIGKLSGRQIDEYELVLLIGQGGMSAVYRAYQEELDRYVAFKILSDSLSTQADYRERFSREAKMAASLEHPNIVPVYDFGNFDESAYVVMRLLNGGTLEQRMKAGRMSTGEILAVVNAMGKALDYAHNRGIIHRDIKPSNIMFDEQGGIYLVDFGIAKAKAIDVSLTAENQVLGTPPYMAPELWRNETVTPAVDQYALAVIAYKMLAGEAPFVGTTPHQLMYQHLNDPVPPIHQRIPGLPTQLSRVLERALSKDPNKRYGSTGVFARALQDSAYLQDSVPPPVAGSAQSSSKQTLVSPSSRPTVPRSPSARPAQMGHPPQTPAPRPTPAPKQDTGDRTLIMRAAIGGGMGLVLLLIFVVIAAIVAIKVFGLGGGGDGETNSNTNQNAPIVLETATNTLTPAPQTGDSFQLTPIAATLAAPNVGQSQMLFNEPQTPVRDVDASRDGRFIASAHGDGLVRLWRGAASSPEVLRSHSDVVNTVAFSPDGELLASAGRDSTIRLWDVNSGNSRATLTGHTGSIRDLQFHPSGSLIATAGEDRTIRLWNINNNQMERSLSTGSSRALAVAFNPDGTLVAGGSEDGLIRVWEVSSGSLVFTLSGHGDSVRGLDFSPNGQLLASSSIDDTIRLWDMASRQTVRTLTGSDRDVWTVTFSHDGSILASGDRGNFIRVWSVADGTQIATLTGHSGWVLGLAFTPDNRGLFSGGGDGTVRIWGIK